MWIRKFFTTINKFTILNFVTMNLQNILMLLLTSNLFLFQFLNSVTKLVLKDFPNKHSEMNCSP
jgi:hypothetical protein